MRLIFLNLLWKLSFDIRDLPQDNSPVSEVYKGYSHSSEPYSCCGCPELERRGDSTDHYDVMGKHKMEKIHENVHVLVLLRKFQT